MNRDEFVQRTVSETISLYLQRFCAPHKIEDVQKRCITDANRLADLVYGVIDVNFEATEAPLPQPARARRLKG